MPISWLACLQVLGISMSTAKSEYLHKSFVPRSEFLPFSPPLVEAEDMDEVLDTLKSTWISTGPKTRQFESEFCDAFGATAALGLNSCTAGLHVALAVLGIGPGDEVITTTNTFCATCNVVEHLGAKPVLVDVEQDTMNIDPEKIEAAITPRTKCILPVHYAGHPVELDAINGIARSHALRVVEDAAHPISAKYKGRFIGSSVNPTAFSFYATKNLTTGEGGMLTGDEEFISKARVISLHGMSREAYSRYDKSGSWKYDVEQPGFKYNMTDIAAALGIWQLRHLMKNQARRREIVMRYNRGLSGSKYFETPTERKEVESALHLYVLRLNLHALTIDRDAFIEELKRRNIGTSVHYIPIHMLSYYRKKYGFVPTDFPVAYGNFLRMLSIPLNVRLTDEAVDDVIEALLDVADKFGR